MPASQLWWSTLTILKQKSPMNEAEKSDSCSINTPPPPVLPHPLSLPGGWGVGDRHLVHTKFFGYGSLCCCVGDCVVRHCHLYPLYSLQDILLTFDEMELDSTTMFTAGKWVPKDLLAPAKPSTNRAKPPPKSAAQSIPVERGEHVQDFKVKWSRTKQFTPSRSRSRSQYIGSLLNASYAECFRFAVQFLCLKVCVRW